MKGEVPVPIFWRICVNQVLMLDGRAPARRVYRVDATEGATT